MLLYGASLLFSTCSTCSKGLKELLSWPQCSTALQHDTAPCCSVHSTVRYHLGAQLTLGLSLCAVTTLQLLYGTLDIMVPTVEQYTTPADEISHPNPRGTRAPAPLLPRGGRGRALLDPLLSQGGIFGSLGYRRDRSVVWVITTKLRATESTFSECHF